MIYDRNIAIDAQIQLTKILGAGIVGAGDIFFVGTKATAAYNWYRSRVPSGKLFTTMNKAIAACATGRNDKIVVLPKYTETISAAGGVTVNKDDVEIIGVGLGTDRPTFTLTATASTFLISGNNVTVRNVYVDATGIDAVVTPFSLTSTQGGTFLSNVEVYFAKTSYVALKVLTAGTAAAANNLQIDSCFFHGDAVANCTNAIQLVGGSFIKITNNVINGNFTTTLGPINGITAVTPEILISGNVLENRTAASTKVVVLYTGSTGRVVNNRILILSGTAPITGDTISVGGNYYAAAIGVAAAVLI